MTEFLVGLSILIGFLIVCFYLGKFTGEDDRVLRIMFGAVMMLLLFAGVAVSITIGRLILH